MSQICATVAGSRIAKEIKDLWEEYEAGQTREAKLMKDLDKFEMILQAEDYEEQQGVDLSQFFDSTRGKIRDSVVSSWEQQLRSRRDARLKSAESLEKSNKDADAGLTDLQGHGGEKRKRA